jgi:hypothetical protein
MAWRYVLEAFGGSARPLENWRRLHLFRELLPLPDRLGSAIAVPKRKGPNARPLPSSIRYEISMALVVLALTALALLLVAPLHVALAALVAVALALVVLAPLLALSVLVHHPHRSICQVPASAAISVATAPGWKTSRQHPAFRSPGCRATERKRPRRVRSAAPIEE